MDGQTWSIFKILLLRQWFVIRKNLPDMFGDGLIAVSLQLIALKFFLPSMGMDTQWQLPLFVGNMLMLCFTVGYQYGLGIAGDIATGKVLYYHAALPVSPRWVITSYLLGAFLSFFTLLFPVGTIGLFILSKGGALGGSMVLGFTMFLVALFFFALMFTYLGIRFRLEFFLDVIWPRILGPMWTFGCLVFTWQRIHSFSPKISYLFLLSPVTYCVEGMRHAILGDPQFLPTWLCVTVLSFICMALLWSVRCALQRRLDIVAGSA